MEQLGRVGRLNIFYEPSRSYSMHTPNTHAHHYKPVLAGFTLIEILVVISVVALLAGFVASAVFSGRTEARDMSRQTDLQQLKLGLKLYKEAYGEYPDYPEGTEIGVGNAIDTELAPFVGEIKSDPLSGTDGDGDYGYWYSSAYACNGETRVVVMARNVEKEKFANYEEVCGTGDSSTAEFPQFVAPFFSIAYAGGGGGGGGSGSDDDDDDDCSVNLPGSNSCNIAINASPSSLSSGGGSVTVCWDSDRNRSDPTRRVFPIVDWVDTSGGWGYHSETVNIDQTTTFTFQTEDNDERDSRQCFDSVTVTVSGSENDGDVPGCMDPGADNYIEEATYDDGSCTYGDEGSDAPGMTERMDLIYTVD